MLTAQIFSHLPCSNFAHDHYRRRKPSLFTVPNCWSSVIPSLQENFVQRKQKTRRNRLMVETIDTGHESVTTGGAS